MKTTPHFKCIITLLAFALTLAWASAAEFRTWTDRKGRTVEGKLRDVQGEIVVVQLKTGRFVEIKKETLSQEDIDYLAEYGGKGAADLDLDAPVKSVAKSIRIDTKAFKKWDKEFVFPGSELAFEVLETPHFLVMTRGSVRAKDTAESAERLWQEMAFQHPSFKHKFADDTRMAIFLVPEESDYLEIGNWYSNKLAEAGKKDEAENFKLTWPKGVSGNVSLTGPLAAEHGLLTRARVLRADSSRVWKGVWVPFRTHMIAVDLISTQAGNVKDYADKGYFAIVRGHSYFKEIELCGNTETRLLDADAYESDEIVSAGGFNEGKRWAKSLKDAIRRGKVHPDIRALYPMKTINVKPTDIVLCYAFARYLQSTVGRLQKFAKLAEFIETSKSIPGPEELAKMYGFETVEEMLEDWKAYMASSAFR